MESRILGCWLGKSIGGTLGIPSEGKMERQYFDFYNPIPVSAPPNDDLELQLVWLHMIEKGGTTLTRQDFAKAWIAHIHYMWDEYGRCRWNLRRGVPVDSVGTFENWFQSSMGSPIRSEIWACLFPGDPDCAAYYAALDASLDHGLDGIAGEVFFAVLQNHVLSGSSIQESITEAIRLLPEDIELTKAILLVHEAWLSHVETWKCREQLLDQHGSDNFTHAPLNVGLTVWALLYGAGDFEQSILLAVNGGYDTDCTAATVGATIGLALGAEAIPDRWSAPLGNGVYVGPGIQNIDAPATLQELTRRTFAAQGKLDRKSLKKIQLPAGIAPDLSQLKGTITLQPFGGSETVLWANGELPSAVKAASGAEWIWHVAHKEPRHLVVLAREGATLSIDGKEVIACPAGLGFVPAPSRSPIGSFVTICPEAGKHLVRLKLDSRNESQEVSVILAYPNRHIAPWTKEELPLAPHLPCK